MGADGFYIHAGNQVLMKLMGPKTTFINTGAYWLLRRPVSVYSRLKLLNTNIYDTGDGRIGENSFRSRREWDFKNGPVHISSKNPQLSKENPFVFPLNRLQNGTSGT